MVRLWDVSSGRLLREFQGHTEGAFSVTFSTHDQTIISAGDDGTIRSWYVATGTQRGVYLGHTGRVWNLALSHDGRTIASAGKDGTIKLWDSELPRDYGKLPIPEPASFIFLPNGQTLMILEAGLPWFIARWDVRSGSLLERKPLDLTGYQYFQAFSRDGQMLAISLADGSLALWDATTGRRQYVLDKVPPRLDPVDFSPDGHYLLVHDQVWKWSLWDLASRRLIPLPWDQLDEAFFRPSGDIIAVRLDGYLSWWDPRTGRSRIAQPSNLTARFS